MIANLESPWFTWARQANDDGTLEQILGNAGHTVTHLMLALQTITRPQIITPTRVRAYSSHFARPADCRGAIRFPQQIVAPAGSPAPESPSPAAVATIQSKPAMLAVGLHDTALLAHHVKTAFRAAYPQRPDHRPALGWSLPARRHPRRPTRTARAVPPYNVTATTDETPRLGVRGRSDP